MNVHRAPRGVLGRALACAGLVLWAACGPGPAAGQARADDESIVFTPAGFDRPGRPATAPPATSARLQIVVSDGPGGGPTPCRVNVVGADGGYYQPAENPLAEYSLTGEWPKTGKGNRVGKAPIRYLGRFFYCTGRAEVDVPPGPVRVEVWKGLEYRPQSLSTRVAAGERRRVEIGLERAIDLATLGYDSGDSHLHFRRETEADEQRVFDLLEAEDIRYGALLGYNEPAGPYHGFRERLDSPQLRGMGSRSERRRGRYRIVSGQEYRSTTYGHLNLFLRDDLVLEGKDVNANNWPLYGLVERETRRRGGYAFMAHGGYEQSIYADFVQGDLSGVELLQFGVYRGIGLADWYRILNIGYRFPCIGASDYPACRKLGDCVTYARQDDREHAGFAGWLAACAGGRSFVTTGPLVLLDVDGQGPGATIRKDGPGPHRVKVRVRAFSVTAPVSTVQLIVNGKTVEELAIPPSQGMGHWIELSRSVDLTGSAWIAARAFGTSSTGSPDAEAHTNPVYAYVGDKAPYDRADLDRLVEKLDGQMNAHRARDFPEKAKVLDYFQKSRDILLRIRAAGGLPPGGVPRAWLDAEDAAAIDPSARSHSDDELKEFLRPVPPRTPAQALETFETVGGFRLELVAAEPLVHSPVAAAFDEDGDLYVAEMTDYPYKPRPGTKPLGSVRLLRDTDGDGRFDRSHVFADGLLWAAGIACWKGGVFVTSPPDIWYLKDTDGDHVADVRRRVYTGFGTENEQGMLNNLAFGLDHKVYGSTSTNGGKVRPAGEPDAPGIDVKGRDFRFDPASERFEAITGTVQFGTTFDDFGNRFLCSESHPLMHAVLPIEALARNPYLPVATGIENVAGGAVPIYRISPLERWRQIRSSRRIAHGERPATSAGASHHVIDAAAGVTVYRGSAYPEEYRGNVFVSDAQNNLIHRMRLTPAGPTFRAARADERTEFVRSYDNWFRPVNLINAPDGTLYALDMSREVIEAIHIPLDVVKHLDLRRGRDQGRIYRIAPPGFRSPGPPRLGSAPGFELVALLERPDGWWRDTAHRLLHERQDATTIMPLRRLVRQSRNPQARIHALWSLHGLDALGEADLLDGLSDPSPHVVEHAVMLSEARLGASPAVLQRVLALASHDDARVRFRVALCLGATKDPRAGEALAVVARRDRADRWTRLAVLSSSGEVAARVFDQLLKSKDARGDEPAITFLEQLSGLVGARNSPAEVRRLTESIAGSEPDRADLPFLRRMFIAFGRGQRQVGAKIVASLTTDPAAGALLHTLLSEATLDARDDRTPLPARLQAIELLGYGATGQVLDTLARLIDPRQPEAVQLAVLRALAASPAPEVADVVLDRYRRLGPRARAEVVEMLLSREPWTLALLKAARRGNDLSGQVDAARRARLLSHKNAEVASLARAAFGGPVADARNAAAATLAAAARLEGDPRRGDELFARHCTTCHRLGARGHAVGPDLSATQFTDAQSLLAQVLDPNRFVAPNYVQYVLSDKGGRVYDGLIASETPSSITLRRAEGVEETVLRSQIDELSSTGKSLMPEDLAAKLTPQELADLAAYILSARVATPAVERLDIGTLPGLIEPEP